MSGRSEPGDAAAGRRQDRHQRRLRRRQDHLRRRDLRDRAAGHRGRDDRGVDRRRRHVGGAPARPPPRSRWTSAGSPSTTRCCSTCSARPARTASRSSGTTWSTARSARSCCVDTRRIEDCFPADRLLRGARHPVPGRRSTPSTARRRFDLDEVREALGIDPTTSRCWSATPAAASRSRSVLVALTEEVLTRRLAEEGGRSPTWSTRPADGGRRKTMTARHGCIAAACSAWACWRSRAAATTRRDHRRPRVSRRRACGTVQIAVNPWVGYAADAAVVSYLLKQELGCDVSW